VTGFDVSPQSLRTASQGVASAAEQLQQQWQSLMSTSQGMGDIFGDDMVGGLIGASYGAAQEIASDSFTSAMDGFSQIAEDLNAMADLYDDTEQVNADNIDSTDAGWV
jgi:uncharacterized protein YukE